MAKNCVCAAKCWCSADDPQVALAERVAKLETAFKHTHAAKYDGETLLRACAECGLDLSDGVHARRALAGDTDPRGGDDGQG